MHMANEHNRVSVNRTVEQTSLRTDFLEEILIEWKTIHGKPNTSPNRRQNQ